MWQTPSLDAWGQFAAWVSPSLLSSSSRFSFFRWFPARRTARNRSSFRSPLWWSRLVRARCSRRSDKEKDSVENIGIWKIQTHTVIHQKQIHADTVSEILQINNNLVHAISAYFFWNPSPGFAVWNTNTEKHVALIFPSRFYLHRESLVLSLKWISTCPDLWPEATGHMIGAKRCFLRWPGHRWRSLLAKDSTCPSFRVIWPWSLQPMNVLLHLNTRSPAWTRCAKAAGKKPILSSITPWKIQHVKWAHVWIFFEATELFGGIFGKFMWSLESESRDPIFGLYPPSTSPRWSHQPVRFCLQP